MSINKVSIVADSGLMKGVFPWAVEKALQHRLGLKKVDVLAGASASAGTFSFTTSGIDGGNVWMNGTTENTRFLKKNPILQLLYRSFMYHLGPHKAKWFNGEDPILNIEYLINTLFCKFAGLDTEKLNNSPIEFIIPVTGSDDHKPYYFSNKDDGPETIGIKSHEDILKVLEATCCVPRMYKSDVEIYGKRYYDGAFSSPLPVSHERIGDSDLILVILTNPREIGGEISSNERKLFKLLNPLLGDALEKGLEARIEDMKKVEEMEKNGQAIVISPDSAIPQFDNSYEAAVKTSKKGLEAVLEDAKLKSAIQKIMKSEKGEFYSSEYGQKTLDWTLKFE